MFNDYKKNLIMLKGSYKKLKSYYYYDKSLVFIKKKIAYFENSGDNFDNTFEILAKSLKYNNIKYFDSLIQDISFLILPKKLSSYSKPIGVIRSNVDHTKNISKINFFIDLPIELLILDTLWMLLIGKIQTDNKCRSFNAYAGSFKKSLFKKGDDLFSGIDFESNRCFDPYFQNYVAWRDNAFSTIEKLQSKSDLILMTLDLQSFYYSVSFDFNSIPSILKNDPRISTLNVLTRVIEKIYSQYTSLIQQYKKGIPKNGTCVFPIGLLSPIVLRESYMKSFDDTILSSLKPNYYARYVDDILLVLSAPELENFSQLDLIEHFLISNQIVSPSGNNSYKLTSYPTLKLQSTKIYCFFFKKGTPNILLNIYKEQIQANSSEANLLPDIDTLNSSFNEKAYDLFSDSGSNKIRDLRFLQSNNYNATIFINNLKRIVKNTIVTPSIVNPFLDEILEFYCDSQGIEFSNNWRSIFELFTLCHDYTRANKLYSNIVCYIKSLNFELLEDNEIYNQFYKKLLHQLKRNLQDALDISISLAIALDYNMGKREELITDAKLFRSSNLLNHQLISVPLINYISTDTTNVKSLIDIGSVLNSISKSEWTVKLDPFKLMWNPRFIHIEELYFSLFIFKYSSIETSTHFHSLLFSKFCKINHLEQELIPPVLCHQDQPRDSRFPYLFKLKINRTIHGNARIGVVSTPINENFVLQSIQNPNDCLTFKRKERLFKILNAAKLEHAQYLSFPEFYLPIAWLPEVWNFSKSNNIAIITGLQYIIRGTQVYNFTCVIEPAVSSKSYRNAILCFREKLYYAPEERKELAKLGFITNNSKTPFYYIFSESNFNFSSILCFEFTDICSRAALKGEIDALFVPQLNKDTHYFSSIVSSSSRDLHCFIIQTNTSIYGDSRITGPYKTEQKNILQIKGGTNDVVILGELDINELRHWQDTYEQEISSDVQKCLNCCKESHEKDHNLCKECNTHKSGHIKGTPPNFHRE